MSDSSSERGVQGAEGSRSLKLLLYTLLSVAVVGFFAGMREPSPSKGLGAFEHTLTSQAEGAQSAPKARTYKQLMSSPWEKNPQWQTELATLAQAQRDKAPVPQVDAAARAHSMGARAQRRAFEGAPPVIPHVIDQRGPMVCASCHTEGINIKGRVARPMSHPFMMNCTQCHVAVESPQPWQELRVEELPLESDFLGARSQDEGGRAFEGAPPLIPHRTWMRQECMSCHGPQGWPGLQTTHPERQSCQQCHGPSNALDQHPQGLP